MSEDFAVEVRVTLPFKRRLKFLAKRYRQIQKDIQPIIDRLNTQFLAFQVNIRFILVSMPIRKHSH